MVVSLLSSFLNIHRCIATQFISKHFQMTLQRNSKLHVKWCACGRMFRGCDLKKHLKEHEGELNSTHRAGLCLSVCTTHMKCSPRLGDMGFINRHVACKQRMISIPAIKSFLSQLKVVYDAGLTPEAQESAEEVVARPSATVEETERAVLTIVGEREVDLDRSMIKDV